MLARVLETTLLLTSGINVHYYTLSGKQFCNLHGRLKRHPQFQPMNSACGERVAKLTGVFNVASHCFLI